MSCPSTIHWLSTLQDGVRSSADDEHLQCCLACSSRLDALRGTAELTFNLPEDDAWRAQTHVPLRLPSPETLSFTEIKPSRGEIWLSAPSFSCQHVHYEDLDSVFFVVLDSSICEAGRQWVDVAPISPEPERAGDLDIVLEPTHTTLQMPLYAQPRRQLVMAFEQLERKVGEVLKDAMQVLDDAAAGRPTDASWLGTPYDGLYDPRIEADLYLESVLERLREPYAQALSEAEEAIVHRASHELEGELAQLIPLTMSFEAPPDSRQYALAAKPRGGQPDILHVADEAHRLDAYLSIDVTRDLVRVTVAHMLAEWVRAVALLVRRRDGKVLTLDQLEIGEHTLGPADAHGLQFIEHVYLRTGSPSDH
jgi:hypothetical protein